MPFWDRIFSKAPDVIRRRFGFVGSPFLTPPERNTRGFLAAYGEIYSLFGVSLRIATAVSEVKWRLYRGTERGERNQIAKHPILTLLDYANEFQTGQEVIELTQLHMDLAGKAFWYLPRNGLGVPAEIWVLAPHLMKPVKDDKKFISGWIFECGMEAIPFDLNEIIWFSMPDPLNPYGGVGYAQAAAVELDSEAYAGRWNRNFFYNSARADAVLESEDTLTDEQFEKLKLQWKTQHGGVSRAHRIAILEAGLKYKQIQISQKDMDFPELRKQTRENLMFTFGMPLPVMGITENVNRANAEAGDYIFARWLQKPRLTRLKNKLNERLVPMFPMAKNVELDYDEVVPETIEQKRQLAESGIKAGYMTVNEARKMQGFDPLPGKTGDVLLMPFNLSPMSVREDLVAPKPPEPSKPPEAPTEQPVVEEESVKGLTDYQKEMFWRAYAFKTENQERKFINAFKGLLEEQQQEVLDNFHEYGDASFDPDFWTARFDIVFRPLIGNTFDSGYEDAEEAFKLRSYTKQAEFRNPLAEEWIANRSLQAVTGINSTTLKLLKIALKEGFALGESAEKISGRIGGFFGETYRGRAKTIARTETIAASNQGALLSYKDAGVQKVEFYTAQDERVDDECAALHGQIFPLEEAEGLIPVHPNCRCTYIPLGGPEGVAERPIEPAEARPPMRPSRPAPKTRAEIKPKPQTGMDAKTQRQFNKTAKYMDKNEYELMQQGLKNEATRPLVGTREEIAKWSKANKLKVHPGKGWDGYYDPRQNKSFIVGGLETTSQTIVHEVGHQYYFGIMKQHTIRTHDFTRFNKLNKLYANAEKTRRVVSTYSLNGPEEYFAEGFMSFVTAPGKLRKFDEGLFNYFNKDIFKGAIQ